MKWCTYEEVLMSQWTDEQNHWLTDDELMKWWQTDEFMNWINGELIKW